MSYVHEKFISADKKIIIEKKHHNLFAMPTKEKIKQRRLPKANETEETQEKINERIRREKYMRLLADNFHAGDFYITFTTAEKMTAEEFRLSMKNFMKRLRREYKKRTGEKIKYFRVLENLIGRGRPHAHMLLPKFCPAEQIRGIMSGLWPDGHVSVQIYGGQAEDAYKVASYFTKQDKKEHGAKIDTSRGNLIRREPKKEIVHAETFRDEIIAPAGYRVVKNLSYNTTTSAGYDYQIAVFEKLEETGRGKGNDAGRRNGKSKKAASGSTKQKPGAFA